MRLLHHCEIARRAALKRGGRRGAVEHVREEPALSFAAKRWLRVENESGWRRKGTVKRKREGRERGGEKERVQRRGW